MRTPEDRRKYYLNNKAKRMTDYCTAEGAKKLSEMIKAYWLERGHDVELATQQGGYTQAMRSTRVDLRSNMSGGLPSKRGEVFFGDSENVNWTPQEDQALIDGLSKGEKIVSIVERHPRTAQQCYTRMTYLRGKGVLQGNSYA